MGKRNSFNRGTDAAPPIPEKPLPGEPITALLQAWSAGDAKARDRLFDLLYPELRRRAQQQLALNRGRFLLPTTELAHEAFLKLVEQRRCAWRSRDQFLAVAATLLRRILVDHAKHSLRRKRGSGTPHVSLDELQLARIEADPDQLLDLDRALVELAEIQATAARVTELRFFAGLDLDETAEVMGLSRSTVQRKWRFARSWLARRLREN